MSDAIRVMQKQQNDNKENYLTNTRNSELLFFSLRVQSLSFVEFLITIPSNNKSLLEHTDVNKTSKE